MHWLCTFIINAKQPLKNVYYLSNINDQCKLDNIIIAPIPSQGCHLAYFCAKVLNVLYTITKHFILLVSKVGSRVRGNILGIKYVCVDVQDLLDRVSQKNWKYTYISDALTGHVHIPANALQIVLQNVSEFHAHISDEKRVAVLPDIHLLVYMVTMMLSQDHKAYLNTPEKKMLALVYGVCIFPYIDTTLMFSSFLCVFTIISIVVAIVIQGTVRNIWHLFVLCLTFILVIQNRSFWRYNNSEKAHTTQTRRTQYFTFMLFISM